MEGGALTESERVVEGIGAGDAEAIARLHQLYSERIFFLALRELRSRPDAEDVRNETVLRVIQAIRAGRLETPAALPGFVIGIARNVIREVLRKGGRTESMEDRDFPAREAAHEVEPGVKRAIEYVIGRLKPRERDFLRLYYYEELSKEQISSRLGIHEDRVRLVKSRALKSFREVYQRITQT